MQDSILLTNSVSTVKSSGMSAKLFANSRLSIFISVKLINNITACKKWLVLSNNTMKSVWKPGKGIDHLKEKLFCFFDSQIGIRYTNKSKTK